MWGEATAVREEMRQDLLAYLQKPGFARIWPLVRAKLERLSRVGGKVKLTVLNGAERTAIAELLSTNLHGRREVAVNLTNLDEASLEECMELLYPGEFVSSRLQREAEATAWAKFCNWARGMLDSGSMQRFRVVSMRIQESLQMHLLVHGSN